MKVSQGRAKTENLLKILKCALICTFNYRIPGLHTGNNLTSRHKSLTDIWK